MGRSRSSLVVKKCFSDDVMIIFPIDLQILRLSNQILYMVETSSPVSTVVILGILQMSLLLQVMLAFGLDVEDSNAFSLLLSQLIDQAKEISSFLGCDRHTTAAAA